MSRLDTCPYCSGSAKKTEGRVVRQPTHLAYGYGERRFQCAKCSEEFIVCYPIPPKSTSGFLPEPNPKLLKATFKEGVSGYANPVVLIARAPISPKPTATGDEAESNEGESK